MGALIERRPYKPPMDGAKAYGILETMTGRLDGDLVRAFRPVAEAFGASSVTGGAMMLDRENPGDDAVARPPPIERCEERRETNWIALIKLPDGTEIPTTVKDISPSGARLAVPRTYALPEQFMLKVVGRDFVCAVRLAWRRDDFLGVRIERIGRLPATMPTVRSTGQQEEQPASVLREGLSPLHATLTITATA